MQHNQNKERPTGEECDYCSLHLVWSSRPVEHRKTATRAK